MWRVVCLQGRAWFSVESGPDPERKGAFPKMGCRESPLSVPPPQTWDIRLFSVRCSPLKSQAVASNDSIVGLAPAIGGFKEAESQFLSPDSCRHQGLPLRPTFGEGYSGVPWGLIRALSGF